MAKHLLLTVLSKACMGLLFRSESDAELEPFVWDDGDALSDERLRTLAGSEEDAPVRTMDLTGFFRAVSKVHRPAFDALGALLNQHLAGVKVYKIGDVEMTVFIVGKTDDGKWAGVKTAVVET